MFLTLLRPFALISTVALSTLGILSRKSRRARYAYHLTLYAGTLGFMSVAGVFISLVATVVGQVLPTWIDRMGYYVGVLATRLNINYLVARSFYGLASPLIGVRLVVEGGEHLEQEAGKEQSAILVGNHQSFFDILYLGRIFPKRASIMAKKELIWAPLLGQYLAASGAVFVDRKNRKNALAAMAEAGDDMKRRGVSLWVFPEGTRSSTPEPKLLPFKKGAFHLAVQAQVPIIPVVCENYHRLFDGTSRFDSGELRIRVLPPISTKGLSPADVADLAESTRQQMLEALIAISPPGPGGSQSESVLSKSSSDKAIMPEVNTSPGDGEVERRTTSGEADDASSGIGEAIEEDEMDEDAVLLRRPSVQ